MKMWWLLLLGAAASRCLHEETQKSVRLLRPPFPQMSTHFRSSILPLPSSPEPQPLRIQTHYTRGPVPSEARDLDGEARALAAVKETTRRIQGILAGM